MVVFLKINIFRKLIITVISSNQWNVLVVSIFWVIWGNKLETHKSFDFWGLYKNKNCAFSFNGRHIYEVHTEGDKREEKVGVLKFVTCLQILFFLNNRSIFHFWKCKGWEGHKIGRFCGRHNYMTPQSCICQKWHIPTRNKQIQSF